MTDPRKTSIAPGGAPQSAAADSGYEAAGSASAEARDALAVALFAQESHDCYDLTTCADAILAALPDGWVLARRQDAEDGAALREIARDAESFIWMRDHVVPWSEVEQAEDRLRATVERHAPTIAEAADRAREALP